MYSEKNTDRVIAHCKDIGFCCITPFFVNIFRRGTFRTIPDDSKGLDFITIGFYNITVIVIDDGFVRLQFFLSAEGKEKQECLFQGALISDQQY